MTGYILALISSLFFSLYIIPRKFTRLDPIYFSLLVGIGFFISSSLLYLIRIFFGFHEIIRPEILWSILGGILWAIGLVSLVKSIDSLGLTRSNQWKNLQGPIGVILSLLILTEYVQVNPVWAILAGLCVFLAAFLINVSNEQEGRLQNLSGISLALLSALTFGAVTVINKYVVIEVGVYSQQVLWAFSIAATLLLYCLFYKNIREIKAVASKDIVLGLVSGLVYLGASFFMLESYKYIPASIGFTIIQLNTIWTFIAGVFFFHEIEMLRHYKRLILGLCFSLAGIALLFLATT